MAGRSRTGARRVASGNYNFTYRRRAQLHRAAIISAERRRGRRIKTAAGVVAGLTAVGVAGYLGHKHGSTVVAAAGSRIKAGKAAYGVALAARKSVNTLHPSPIGKPIVNGVQSKIPHTSGLQTAITQDAKARANKVREDLAKPRADRRIYHEDGSVNTEAMTNRSARQTLRRGRKATQGKKVAGKAKQLKRVATSSGGLSASQWHDALAFDETPRRVARPK